MDEDVTRSPSAGQEEMAPRRRMAMAVAAAAALSVMGGTSCTLLADGATDSSSDLSPSSTPPPTGADGVPVWYDADGLHRGDLVLPTSVPLRQGTSVWSPLTLVRSGALYVDRARREMWLQPWDGKARVVGSEVTTGPGGDPAGDTAAWFEGDELVVYDTAGGRVLQRIDLPSGRRQLPAPAMHLPAATFVEVSDDRVTWLTDHNGALSVTVATGELGELDAHEASGAVLVDAVAGREVLSTGHADLPQSSSVAVRSEGGRRLELPDLEAGTGRLSPDGTLLLAVTEESSGHRAVTIDVTGVVRTDLRGGEADDVPLTLAWSYDDTVLMLRQTFVGGEPDPDSSSLQACDAVSGTCSPVATRGLVVLPS